MNEPTKQDQEFYENNTEFEIDEAFDIVEKEMRGGDDKMNYPKYQWSLFTRNGKDEQYVVREDDYDAFVEAKRQILADFAEALVQSRGTTPQAETKADPQVAEEKKYACEECGAEAILKSGVSKKTGKPWKGVFCTENKDHVTWL